MRACKTAAAPRIQWSGARPRAPNRMYALRATVRFGGRGRPPLHKFVLMQAYGSATKRLKNDRADDVSKR